MNILKKIWPYAACLLVFAMVSLVYFHPVLQGKVILQGDIMNFKGMSQEIKTFREETGQEPLWTNAMFGGMPAYQISTLYPANLIYKLDKILLGLLPHPANYLFLLFAGFFAAGLMAGAGLWVSAAMALGFGLSSYSLIVIEAGHNSKVHAIAYFAPVLGAILLAYRGHKILGSLLTALFLSFEIATNHLQITYYLLLTVLCLGAVTLLDRVRKGQTMEFIKTTGLLVVAAVLAVLPNITGLMATYEYGQYTMRGKSDLKAVAEKTSGLNKDYALGWSYGVAETGTLLIPNFHGGASGQDVGPKSNIAQALKENGQPANVVKQLTKQAPTYWGDQPFTSGPVYLGAAIIFLFIFGLIVLDSADRWWILAAAIVSVVLSWGKNFPLVTDFFFDYFPGYNKFRAVSMTLVIAQVVVPFLGLLLLKQLFTQKLNETILKKKALLALYISGGFCLVFALVPGVFFSFDASSDEQLKGSFPEWFLDALIADRAAMLRWDAFRSLAFISAAFGIFWFWFSGKLNGMYATILLGIVFLTDLGGVGKRYVNADSFVPKSRMEKPYQPTEADVQILKDTDPNFRVLNAAVNTFNDASTSYFHKSIGGYHGAKLKRYQELIDSCISKNNMEVLNMLNTKYIIQRGGEGSGLIPRQNPFACGNAWFVKQASFVENADEELASLNGKDFKAKETAIVDKTFAEFVKKPGVVDSLSSIKLTSYKPNELRYIANSSTGGTAVFSEIYYPKGWNAYVNGKLEPHFRANYVLRAMQIPSGKNEIVFKFEPEVYKTGERIALAGSIVLLLVVVGGIVWEVKKSNLA